MSALTGSDGENHLHDKQFSDCHVILFNVFLVSSAVVVIQSRLQTLTPWIKEFAFVQLVFYA
jgi:hypothetical protein